MKHDVSAITSRFISYGRDSILGTIKSFIWGEFKQWADREGLRISVDPHNQPSCQFIGCSMNEDPNGCFKDRDRIRLWKIEHAVSVKMIGGKSFRQPRVDVLVCCARHEWNLPAGCKATLVSGRSSEIFQLAAEVLRFSVLERAISNVAREKGTMRRTRPADVTLRNNRRALRS